jgi:hypothetical protein
MLLLSKQSCCFVMTFSNLHSVELQGVNMTGNSAQVAADDGGNQVRWE